MLSSAYTSTDSRLRHIYALVNGRLDRPFVLDRDEADDLLGKGLVAAALLPPGEYTLTQEGVLRAKADPLRLRYVANPGVRHPDGPFRVWGPAPPTIGGEHWQIC